MGDYSQTLVQTTAIIVLSISVGLSISKRNYKTFYLIHYSTNLLIIVLSIMHLWRQFLVVRDYNHTSSPTDQRNIDEEVEMIMDDYNNSSLSSSGELQRRPS